MIKSALAPKEAITTELYSVYIKQIDCEWQKLSVYIALCPNGASNWTKLSEEAYSEFDGISHGTVGEKTYFVNFDFDNQVEVKVVYNDNVKNFNFKPESSGINGITDENTVTFELKKPGFITVEPDGNIFRSLHIFANPVEAFQNAYENIIEFKSGYYTADNCECIEYDEHGTPVINGIPDNTLIYLHHGAVVNAAIILKGVHNIKISGRGSLSLIKRCYGAEHNFQVDVIYGGFRYFAVPSIYICSGSDNIIIDGIAIVSEFRGITIRNSENITINNTKIFTYCANGDGINCVNVNNMIVKNSYLETADDNFAVFTSYDSIPTLNDEGYLVKKSRSTNIEVSDCVLWTNCRPFMIGGHGTKSTGPHDVIENIYIHDNEIIDVAFNIFGNPYEHSFYWSGILRILSQSSQLINKISFKNINVNWTKGYTGKPIHIEVRNSKTASYSEAGGYRIKNIEFENIRFYNCCGDMMPSVIIAEADHNKNEDMISVDNVRFNNVSFNGRPLVNDEKHLIIRGNINCVAFD